jgi:hypothetical protein
MEFGSIDKLKIIFGIAEPQPTVLVEPANEPSSTPKPSVPPPCFKLNPYWKKVFEFWEGYRPYRYRDSEGYWTVGIGTLIDTDRVSIGRIQNRLGQHFTDVMDGIDRDTDPRAGKRGSRNGFAPMPGTQQRPISIDVAWQWAESDVQKHFLVAYNFIGAEAWNRLPYAVQCVLVSLSYQAPIEQFVLMRAALQKNPPNYKEAARQMENSTWYNQTQKDRRGPMIAIMKSGGTNIPAIGNIPSSPEAKINPCGTSNPNTGLILDVIEMVTLSGGPIMP